MHVGFVKLCDLHGMFVAMKERLPRSQHPFSTFRPQPGQETAVNRRLLDAFKDIAITRKVESVHFCVPTQTASLLFAEMIEGSKKANLRITRAAATDGAQTLGSFDAFIDLTRMRNTHPSYRMVRIK